MAAARDAGRGRKRRVHEYDGRPKAREKIGDGFSVVAGDVPAREQAGEQVGAERRDLVEVERTRSAAAERAPGHDGEHPGAGGGFEHDVARTDRGRLERRIGERQRRGELLQANLVLGTPGVGGFQGRERRQQGEHVAGAVGTAPGAAAHGPAVAEKEENDGRLGGFVGVLP